MVTDQVNYCQVLCRQQVLPPSCQHQHQMTPSGCRQLLPIYPVISECYFTKQYTFTKENHLKVLRQSKRPYNNQSVAVKVNNVSMTDE